LTQEDPIGLAGGLNLYGYANADPINQSDPFGLCPPCSERDEGWGNTDAGFFDLTQYFGPGEAKLAGAFLLGMVSDASKVAFKGAIGRIVAGFTERFGAAVERTAATGARQAEFTVGKNGTKLVVRGPETHPIPGSGGRAVTHYNVEVHVPTGQPGRFSKLEDTHLDENGWVLDP
jgi:hypothetical protein